MRHLIGAVLAVVMAAAIFFVASWGYLKLLVPPPRGGPLLASGSLIHDHVVLEGFAALLAVGLLAGILIAVPRISPLAAGLPGLVLLAWTGLYLFSVRRAVQYIPLKTHAYGAGFENMLVDGMLVLVGAAMIIPLFVPSRWRSRSAAEAGPAPYQAAAAAHPELQDTRTMAAQDTQTMAGGAGQLPDWSETRPQPRSEPGPSPWDQTRPLPRPEPARSQPPWGPADPSSLAEPGSHGDGRLQLTVRRRGTARLRWIL